MITLSGTLNIRSITGRYGPFNVGRLETDLGAFAVKDSRFEQYDPGCYAGEFGITRIYPDSYFAGNRFVVEVRAVIEKVALTTIDDVPSVEAEMEPDPVDTERAESTSEISTPRFESDAADGNDLSDDALFSELWPLGEKVKLDTTVDRALFRCQTRRLHALGYTFQPIGQVWLKQAPGE